MDNLVLNEPTTVLWERDRPSNMEGGSGVEKWYAVPALKFVCVMMCMSLVAAINKLSVGLCVPAVPSSLTRAINALTIALLNMLADG